MAFWRLFAAAAVLLGIAGITHGAVLAGVGLLVIAACSLRTART